MTEKSPGKIRNRRAGIWFRRVLVAVAVLLVYLAILNWGWSSRIETEYRNASLFNNGETLLVNSFSLRPDFWNFLRSKRDNKYHAQSSWDKTRVFRRQGSVWELEREISSTQPLAGYEDHPHVVFFWDLASQEVLSFNILNIYDFSSVEDDASESLARGAFVRPGPAGSAWKVQDPLKDILEIDSRAVSYHHSPQTDLLVALDHSTEVLYTLTPDGDSWRLESELSARSPVFGIDAEVEADPKIGAVALGGSTLVVSIETNSQENPGTVQFLRWDGSGWQLEQIIDHRSLSQLSGRGSDYGGHGSFQAVHVDDDRALLMYYGNDRYWVVFERDSQTDPSWLMTRNSRDSDCGIPFIDGVWMMARCGAEINIFKDAGDGWQFSQKLPDVGWLWWSQFSRAETRPMVGGRLRLVNESENQIHIFELRGETWELEQTLTVK